MSGGLAFVALLGIIFPLISLIAAIWFFFSGELTLGIFFFIWFILWDDEPERNS